MTPPGQRETPPSPGRWEPPSAAKRSPPTGHRCLVDVKAVTLHCFRVIHKEVAGRAVVVLDV